MLWAASSARHAFAQGGRVLPVPFPTLGKVVKPLAGQTVMLIAAPGVGKTTFGLNWAALSGARTLYASADQDPLLTTVQLSALATRHPRDEVLERMRTSETWRASYADAMREAYPNLVMDYASSPRVDVLAEKAEALTEAWGETPELVVVDTASNLYRTSDEPMAWEANWQEMVRFARYFNCIVMMPHHVKHGAARNGNIAPEQADGMYNADKFSEIVIGLHRSSPTHVIATVLKNRGGKRGVTVPFRTEHEVGLMEEAMV